MEKLRVAGIGELLWDVLGDSEELGGAPVNFAFHANSLGARGYAVSTVGDDRRGDAALAHLVKRNMVTDYITVLTNVATGYVVAEVDEDGVASYTFPDDVAWDRLTLGPAAMALAGTIDAVCFGSLGQRSPAARRAITSFLEATPVDCLKVFDMNLRQHFYSREILHRSLAAADIVKLNDDELAVLQEIDQLHGDETSLLQQLTSTYMLQLAVLTRGGQGSLLVAPEEISDHPGYPADIVDTIGAGDSFTAAVVLGLLRGDSLQTINIQANRVAAFVCSQPGGMPELPDSLGIR